MEESLKKDKRHLGDLFVKTQIVVKIEKRSKE